MFILVIDNCSKNNVAAQRFAFGNMQPKLIVHEALDALQELICEVYKNVKYIKASSSKQEKFIEDAISS